jgi:Rod binding domain-containing protein
MFDSAALLDNQADFALTQGKSQIAAPTAANDPSSMKAAAQNFESVFLSQMFSQMFDGVKTDTMFGGGEGEEMFRSLLLDEYAKQVAKKGGVGIADAVMRTLIREQEKKS